MMREDPQLGMFEEQWDDPTLESLLEEIVRHRDTVRAYNRARRKFRDWLRAQPIEDGKRYRIGRWTFTGIARSGGGFEIPEWETVTPGPLEAID